MQRPRNRANQSSKQCLRKICVGGVRVCVCQTKSLSRSSRRADLSEEPRTVPGIPSRHRRHEFKQKCVCMIGVVDLRFCLKSLFLRVMAPSPWFEVVPESRTTGDLSENVVVHLSLVWFTTILESYNKIITHKKRKQMDKDNLPEKLITTIPRVYCCNCYAESISSCSFPKLIVASYLPPLMCIYAQNQHTLFYSYIPCIFKPSKTLFICCFSKVTPQTVISMIQIQCD